MANKLIKQQSYTKPNKGSVFKGVTLDKYTNLWFACINYKSRHYFLGRYKLELDAAKKYNEFAKYFYGDHATLNPI